MRLNMLNEKSKYHTSYLVRKYLIGHHFLHLFTTGIYEYEFDGKKTLRNDTIHVDYSNISLFSQTGQCSVLF